MPRLAWLGSAAICAASCGDDGDATAIDTTEAATDPVTSSESTTAVATTTFEPTTTAADSSSSGNDVALPECPAFATGTDLGAVVDPEIVETSGLAISRAHPDVLWLHNDSGDGARAFAIRTDGTTLGQLELSGALSLDWEDIALGPGPMDGVDYLYIGDIGDNVMFRAYVTAYRVVEPDPRQLGAGAQLTATALDLHYPDGPHDAEAMMSDPRNGDLYLVSKSESGSSGVYRAASPHLVGENNELELVASVTFGVSPLFGSPQVTGGDIAPDGSFIVLRTYSAVYGWRRAPDMTIAEAFATEPCLLPSMDEPGGEAITIGSDGYYTVSEGEMIPVWFFAAE